MEKEKWYLKYKVEIVMIIAFLAIDVAVDSIAVHFFSAPLPLRLTFNIGVFCSFAVTYLVTRNAWKKGGR